MQYLNDENFIFPSRKRFLGGMHKVFLERQMFLCQNHTCVFKKWDIKFGYKMRKCWPMGHYLIRLGKEVPLWANF